MRAILFILSMMLGGFLAFFLSDSQAQPIVTESTARTRVESPPPSAISPNITTINNRVCSTGVSAAIQTQILGISTGTTVRDANCELVLLAETLFNMQMKTAAVTILCQDHRVFWAMWNAGTFCPIDGKVGLEAKVVWENSEKLPKKP
jgi:hypothetical protein